MNTNEQAFKFPKFEWTNACLHTDKFIGKPDQLEKKLTIWAENLTINNFSEQYITTMQPLSSYNQHTTFNENP